MRPIRDLTTWLSGRNDAVRRTAIALCLLAVPPASVGGPALDLSPTTSTDGVARLSWELPQTTRVTLQSSATPDFRQPRTLYVGHDSATTLTGLADGNYYYRIGIATEPPAGMQWSDVVHLEVSHHSMTRAWSFFALGVLVFAGVLVVVVTGARRHGTGTS
jgi:hypothetical protein